MVKSVNDFRIGFKFGENMKKALTALLALTIATACKAEDSKQVAELKKRCEQLSKETGITHFYGSGELKHFSQLVLFSDDFPPIETLETPKKRPKSPPPPYGGDFITPDGKRIIIGIKTAWKNPEADFDKLELVPLPVSMETGKKYHFCYRIPEDSKEYVDIDHPETIQLIKE